MAISWSTQITKVNKPRADVTFTRTDDAAPGDLYIKKYNNVLLETSQQRLDLLDAVWTAWQKELVARGVITTFLDNLEQQANSNLDLREV